MWLWLERKESTHTFRDGDADHEKKRSTARGEKGFSGALVLGLHGPSGLPCDHAMEEKMNAFTFASHGDVCY